MQESAYCVRGSRRQEELDYLHAVFGDEVIALVLVAVWYEIADLAHELHQSILWGEKEKIVTFTQWDVQ